MFNVYRKEMSWGGRRLVLETGKVVPVIDRRYPLSATAEALRYLEAGHARGKVMIAIESAGAT